jgi:hypothetical protein
MPSSTYAGNPGPSVAVEHVSLIPAGRHHCRAVVHTDKEDTVAKPWTRRKLRLAVVIPAVATLTAGSIVFAPAASAHVCVHSSHWDGSVFMNFEGHHTHSNGEHHHVWNGGSIHAVC